MILFGIHGKEDNLLESYQFSLDYQNDGIPNNIDIEMSSQNNYNKKHITTVNEASNQAAVVKLVFKNELVIKENVNANSIT